MALLRSLARALILSEDRKIITTEARAKEARKLVERLITIAKTDDVHSRRMVARILGTERKVTPAERKKGIEKVDPIRKLFEEIAPRFAGTPGGYTRVTRIGRRRGDSAMMAALELTL